MNRIARKMRITTSALLLLAGMGSVQAKNTTIDDMEGAAVEGWYQWPKKNPFLSLSDEAKVGGQSLKVDLREEAGLVARVIKDQILDNPQAKGVSMWLKAAGGNQKETLNIVLQEGKGKERYNISVKLTDEWKLHKLNFDDFGIIRYGGAKIVNETLDVADISTLKFESFPKGNVFLVDDIRLMVE